MFNTVTALAEDLGINALLAQKGVQENELLAVLQQLQQQENYRVQIQIDIKEASRLDDLLERAKILRELAKSLKQLGQDDISPVEIALLKKAYEETIQEINFRKDLQVQINSFLLEINQLAIGGLNHFDLVATDHLRKRMILDGVAVNQALKEALEVQKLQNNEYQETIRLQETLIEQQETVLSQLGLELTEYEAALVNLAKGSRVSLEDLDLNISILESAHTTVQREYAFLMTQLSQVDKAFMFVVRLLESGVGISQDGLAEAMPGIFEMTANEVIDILGKSNMIEVGAICSLLDIDKASINRSYIISIGEKQYVNVVNIPNLMHLTTAKIIKFKSSDGGVVRLDIQPVRTPVSPKKPVKKAIKPAGDLEYPQEVEVIDSDEVIPLNPTINLFFRADGTRYMTNDNWIMQVGLERGFDYHIDWQVYLTRSGIRKVLEWLSVNHEGALYMGFQKLESEGVVEFIDRVVGSLFSYERTPKYKPYDMAVRIANSLIIEITPMGNIIPRYTRAADRRRHREPDSRYLDYIEKNREAEARRIAKYLFRYILRDSKLDLSSPLTKVLEELNQFLSDKVPVDGFKEEKFANLVSAINIISNVIEAVDGWPVTYGDFVAALDNANNFMPINESNYSGKYPDFNYDELINMINTNVGRSRENGGRLMDFIFDYKNGRVWINRDFIRYLDQRLAGENNMKWQDIVIDAINKWSLYMTSKRKSRPIISRGNAFEVYAGMESAEIESQIFEPLFNSIRRSPNTPLTSFDNLNMDTELKFVINLLKGVLGENGIFPKDFETFDDLLAKAIEQLEQ